ncbi:MAG: ACT domain-containing protein [Dokdonella sp.]|jgi:acetolactate synthase II small subunit|uniref:ACT domain-containing protein n=1 Tax=Dokdonella sp. TaxID=2291710 RepID=UPI001B6177FA|nr:ACT domain-containing protein [Dokdonella sp.]MCC6439052.1 acetolactate synthase [Rhodanobacteraceae bacterium]MBK8124184.1 acetolactate synthase [Dokdonella sp.]MBP6325823.1 acetolactate synthase [Dokdonella sp.]MBP6328262.1 acetolactate synthase [Dokdonella sp.]HNV07778.1 ACT domain-containing protein [Dokdonella sp.]
MPRYQLDLTLRRAEGALGRVIGTAERRGFRPLSVDGETREDGDRWYLRLSVEGERSAEFLTAQLEKLYDCLAVEAMPCP